jgi:2-polyprenyl-3-methyl-5-hydroxy-6-metoxy-1,4-benzoquinol methylase
MKAFVHSETVYNTGSASEIVPIINQIIRPKSVVDVGCGLGTFLKVFKDQGVQRVLGIDGEWVDKALLSKNISITEFIVADLEKEITINEKFDLAISLEVAEHISENSADLFIRSLTNISKVILKDKINCSILAPSAKQITNLQ